MKNSPLFILFIFLFIFSKWYWYVSPGSSHIPRYLYVLTYFMPYISSSLATYFFVILIISDFYVFIGYLYFVDNFSKFIKAFFRIFSPVLYVLHYIINLVSSAYADSICEFSFLHIFSRYDY